MKKIAYYAQFICYSAVTDPCNLMEKGAFEDLTPFMQSSGVREEDYFPAAFSGWKNDGKIYGLNCMANQEGAWEFLSFLLSEEVQSSFAVDDLAQGLLEMANGYFIRGIRAMLGGRG